MNAGNVNLPGDYPHFEQTFEVRMSELNCEGAARVSAIFDYLQEAASNHAEKLGIGLDMLYSESRTWMLRRLTVDFARWPKWRERLTVRTWPSAASKKLIAHRDFVMVSDNGDLIACATSEWLFIDAAAQKIARLPDSVLDIVNDGTPRVGIDVPAPPSDFGGEAELSAQIPLRYSDLDVNRHANNTRYIDWMLEPLRDAQRSAIPTMPERIDIVFKNGAKKGDTVRSQCAAAERPSGGAAARAVHHRILRDSDDLPLIYATSIWK